MSADGIFNRIGDQLAQNESDEVPVTMSDLLDLPDDQRSVVREVMRSSDPMTSAEVADSLGWPLPDVERLLGDLSLLGMIEVVSGRIKMSPMHRTTRATPGGLWGLLDEL
jgi:hypothetical protein